MKNPLSIPLLSVSALSAVLLATSVYYRNEAQTFKEKNQSSGKALAHLAAKDFVQSNNARKGAGGVDAQAVTNRNVQQRPAAVASRPSWSSGNAAAFEPFGLKNISLSGDEAVFNFTLGYSLNADPDKLAKKIGVKPGVRIGSVVPVGNVLYVKSRDFKAGETYTFQIPADELTTTTGALLKRDVYVSVKKTHKNPSFDVPVKRNVYPVKGGRKLIPYETCNISTVNVVVAKAYVNTAFGFHLNSDWYSDDDVEWMKPKTKTIVVNDPFDVKKTRALDLADVLGGDCGTGLYRISFSAERRIKTGTGGYWWEDTPFRETVVFNVTDLSARAVADGSGTVIVCVNRISDGSVVPGAKVQLVTTHKQIASDGVTGADGTVRLDFTKLTKDGYDMPDCVNVQFNGDCFSMKVSPGPSPDDTLLNPTAFVFTQRDVCRPGEDFNVYAMIKRLENDCWTAVGDSPFEFRLFNPSGKLIATKKVKGDRLGLASTSFKTSEDWATGTYEIQCGAGDVTWGSADMRVSSYVPDRINVTLNPSKEGFAPDGAIEFAASAKYYFGADVPDTTWNLVVKSSRSVSEKETGWNKVSGGGWMVGDPDSWKPGDFNLPSGSPFQGSSAKCLYPGFASCEGKASEPVKLRATATVQEPGGRGVSATAELIYYPLDWFIGLRSPQGKGIVQAVALKSPEAASGSSAVVKVSCKLWRRRWEYVLVRNSAWYREWKQIREPAGEFDFTLDIGSAEPVALPLPAALENGEYELLASAGSDRFTRLVFSKYSTSAARSRNPSVLELSSDAPSGGAKEGGMVNVKFVLPQQSHILIASGQKCINAVQSLVKPAGCVVVPVKIPEHCPGSSFKVLVTAVSNIAKSRPDYMMNMIEIPVDHAKEKFSLNIATANLLEPGTFAAVTVKVDRAESLVKPVHAFVFATDEGILALTGFTTPDPAKRFFNVFESSIFRLSEFYSQLFPELKINEDGTIGGDTKMECLCISKMLSQGVVKQKDAVRLAFPPVVLSNGCAVVKFTVPEHSGKLRFMAVATDGPRVGCGSDAAIVRRRIERTASHPRFAAPGDKFRIETVVNDMDHPESDRVESVEKTAPQQLGMFDGVKIRALSAMEIRTKLAVLAKDETYNPKQDAALWVGDYATELREASSPGVILRDARDYLANYPYGCLEQTVSCAVPGIVAESFVKLDVCSKEEVETFGDDKMQDAMTRILSMLDYQSGSFKGWPGSSWIWNDAGVYAARFLFTAHNMKKIKLPGDARKAICKNLRRLAESGAEDNILLAARAARALALAGDEAAANAARRILDRSKFDLAEFIAASALIRAGYASEASDVPAKCLSKCCFAESDSSQAAAIGEILYIASTLPAAIKQQLKPQLENLRLRLVSLRRSDSLGWGCTQNNAWAILGLTSFAPSAEKDKRYVFVRQTGIPVKPSTNGCIKVSKTFKGMDGRLISGEVPHGELVEVVLEITSPVDIENFVLSDLLPGGFEIEDGSFKTRAAQNADAGDAGFSIVRREPRDDRYLVFGSLFKGKNAKISYLVRASYPGDFAVPAASVEDMYNPDARGLSAASRVKVSALKKQTKSNNGK